MGAAMIVNPADSIESRHSPGHQAAREAPGIRVTRLPESYRNCRPQVPPYCHPPWPARPTVLSGEVAGCCRRAVIRPDQDDDDTSVRATMTLPGLMPRHLRMSIR